MKQAIAFLAVCLYFNTVFAQKNTSYISIHQIQPVYFLGRVESPAYIDSSLFSRYLNWNLQPDSLPTNPAKGYELEIWYVVSKNGRISIAKSRLHLTDTLTNYVIQKFTSFPYQWSPAYQNGRPVNSYHKIKIVF